MKLIFLSMLFFTLSISAGNPIAGLDLIDKESLHENVYRKLCRAVECATWPDG